MRSEPKNYDFDPHKFILEHGEELENNIIHEEDISDVFDFILESNLKDIREAKSILINLYTHMLKYKYQQDHQTRSWINTIRRSVKDLDLLIESSRTLANKITDELQTQAYENAIRSASRETRLPLIIFPSQIPDDLAFELISDPDYVQSYLDNYAYSYEAKKVLHLI